MTHIQTQQPSSLPLWYTKFGEKADAGFYERLTQYLPEKELRDWFFKQNVELGQSPAQLFESGHLSPVLYLAANADKASVIPKWYSEISEKADPKLFSTLIFLMKEEPMREWFSKPNQGFKNQTPADIIRSGNAELLFQMILQIHGNVAS